MRPSPKIDSEPPGVEVAYADAQRQWLLRLPYRQGMTALAAIEESGLRALAGIAIDPRRIGVFGRRVEPGTPLAPGDRVEIYRPLQADPKQARRARAAARGRARSGFKESES